MADVEAAKAPAKKGLSPIAIGLFVVSALLVVAGIVVVVIFATQPPPSPPAMPPPSPPPAPISPAAAPGAALAILGHYLTDWGTALTITPTMYYAISSYGTSAYTIDSFGTNYLIMQNPADDAWNPSQWSKVEWHTAGTGFGYCTTIYSAATAREALLTDTRATYDPTNAATGCGASGFAHTVATPYAMPIAGTYLDNWGSYHTINNEYWFKGSDYNTLSIWGADVAVFKTSPTAWDPNTWSKSRFHAVGTGYGYCDIAYGKSTADLALAADASAYNSSNAAKGCNGFGHSVMTPYAMPIIGSYTDNYGSSLTITATMWGENTIVMYTDSWAIFHKPTTASWNPDTYTKVFWHAQGAGYGYCEASYGNVDVINALTNPAVYNASDAATGCGGTFGHTIITAASGR